MHPVTVYQTGAVGVNNLTSFMKPIFVFPKPGYLPVMGKSYKLLTQLQQSTKVQRKKGFFLFFYFF